MDDTLALTALGVPVDVAFLGPQSAEAHAALAERWSLCIRDPAVPATGTVSVALGKATADPDVVAGTDLAQLMVDVTHRITFTAIEANIGRLLMFHAAGVASLRTGATLICVAPGGTGKTTLCRTLAPGRGYVSDETVGVAADGTLRPYPKPLSVRRDDSESKDEIEPGRFGLQVAPASAYAAGLLVLDRDPAGPDTPELEDLDLFAAATAVAPETSSLSRLPRPLHLLADLVDSLTIVARVRYREAASLEPLFSQVLGPPLERTP